MTKRAILWCGQVRRSVHQRDAEGRVREVGDHLLPTDDFKLQVNGLELAFRSARALGVPRDEIYACVVNDDLAPEELRTERHEATVEGLVRLVRAIGRRVAADDALLFVAVNHGIRDGSLATADPPADELDDDGAPVSRLTPQVLDDCLRSLPGPQILVLATCFAGAFLPLGHDARRTVIAACAATEEYRVVREDGACSAFLDELFGAWCGVTHCDAVPAAKLPLDAAFARARERLASSVSLNVPLFAGVAAWPA